MATPSPLTARRKKKIFCPSQNLYLSCLASTFVIAFLSYYVQFPGLNSSSGLEPGGRVFPHLFPWLHRFLFGNVAGVPLDKWWVEVDVLCESTVVVGLLLSCLAASGIIQHGLVYLTMTICYYFITQIGGTFYSFQWDSLLIEVGWLTGLCYAPWTTFQPHPHWNESVGRWPLRFLLFKLMIMSGVVKIQSECPTWLQLTALEYHFCTQCLPNAVSYWAHQLPPLILRLSVALTFLIEIPVSFLVLAPIASWREVGAKLQLLLQVLILCTGNYNFFNLLTMALCIPCFDVDTNKSMASIDNKGFKPRRGFQQKTLEVMVCFMGLSWCFNDMFSFHASPGTPWNLSFNWTRYDCDSFVNLILPLAVVAAFVFPLVSFALGAWSNQRRLHGTSVLHLVTCLLCLGMTSVPLTTLTLSLRRHPLLAPTRLFAQPWTVTQTYRISNSYGLFRTMTGVGPYKQESLEENTNWGWAGVPPSIVQRPELILEGRRRGAKAEDEEDVNHAWRELKFRWKPGNVVVQPKQVAPHQPRLDWQMWFAALGRNYNQNPWLIQLIDKILSGCTPVINLLDEPDLSIKDQGMDAIKVLVYHYDFTRSNTTWAQRIPGVNLNSTHWWSRTFSHEYLPELKKGDAISEFLSAHGFHPVCLVEEERCNALNSIGQTTCILLNTVRATDLLWLPVLLALCFQLKRAYRQHFSVVPMNTSTITHEKKHK